MSTTHRPTAIVQQNGKKPLFIAIALAFVLGLAAMIGWRVTAAPDLAPEVTYGLIDGTKLTTTGLKGKVVLVNFWATSCVTCVAEMPQLAQTHQKFAARGYETIAVAMSYDRADYVLNFVKTRALPFKVALDVDGNVAEKFNKVKVTPTSLLIDAKGRILRRWVGEPDFAALHGLIEAELGRKS